MFRWLALFLTGCSTIPMGGPTIPMGGPGPIQYPPGHAYLDDSAIIGKNPPHTHVVAYRSHWTRADGANCRVRSFTISPPGAPVRHVDYTLCEGGTGNQPDWAPPVEASLYP